MADATRASSKGLDDGVHDPETDLDEIDDDLDDCVDPDPELREPPTLAWRRRTAIEMVISGALGLLASFVLSIDALKLAADPNADLSCTINQVIDCSTVAQRTGRRTCSASSSRTRSSASQPRPWSSRSRSRCSAA